MTDPHAWQDLANGKLYVANIRDGLIAADPAGKAVYEANAAKYLDAIAQEETAVKQALGALPEARRKIITSHDAFGYFGAAYGLEIIAPEGVSTESEASAQDVAKIIRQIKAEKIPAVFIENITDHRLLDQIARETGAKIGGTLYSDALSPPDGPAPTYLDMFRHNVGTLTAALSSLGIPLSRSKWLWPGVVVLLAAIAVATLVPAGWQIRFGLHWLVEHFLAYFAVTAIFCLAWPRPMAVAAVLLPVAVLLETAQGLTPDRTADPATALSAATGVAVAALLADLVLALGKRRKA